MRGPAGIDAQGGCNISLMRHVMAASSPLRFCTDREESEKTNRREIGLDMHRKLNVRLVLVFF